MRLEPKPVTSPAPRLAPSVGGTRPLAPAPTAPLNSPDALRLSGASQNAPAASASLSDLVAKAKEAAARKPEWTMAVNLAASLGDQFGAVSKGQQLRDLAKETEGKPVTIVAQQMGQGPEGPFVERFVIKDGKVTSQGQSPSRGFAEDLEALTAMAAKDHPAKRMGVVIQSHGTAIKGMSGDNGGASLSQLADAMRRGMERGGRSKLDVLDFDACLMGQQEVLSAVSGLSEHVLASPELELANSGTMGGKVDGQPVREMMRALLQDPGMDGEAFARKAVELASQAARPFDVDKDGKADADIDPLNATPTLSHFDMEHMPAMNRAMDGLGSALSAAMREPAQRQAIMDLISRAPRYSASEAEGNGHGLQQRDLKTFSEGLQGAIAQGKLKDPSGSLSKAATATLEALNSLVGAYHGEEKGALPGIDPQNYRDMGGLGVFMPSAEFLTGTPETLATPLAQIADNAGYFSRQVADPQATAEERTRAKALFLRGAGNAMRETWERLPDARRADFTPLAEAFDALEQAETPAEISAAAKRYGEVAAKLQDGPAGQLLTRQKADERRELVDQAYGLARPHMTEGWKEFTQALREGA